MFGEIVYLHYLHEIGKLLIKLKVKLYIKRVYKFDQLVNTFDSMLVAFKPFKIPVK